MGLLIIAVLTVASTLSLAGPIIASLLSSDRGMVGAARMDDFGRELLNAIENALVSDA